MRNYHFLTVLLAALLLVGCGEKKQPTTFTEETSLEFLYQYMPLGDSVDYPLEFHQECVQYAFKAKEEMPWGKDIPEREFKHFVLPARVNNENLDAFRITYYEELKNRVKDLSLYDAVLEVNHWCHEHVNYKGSDSRTSAPMATIKTSWGRCGEESTLLVTALRTVGIPARQVYTPRWAHCDDNHAWVEAWVNGQWHFLGACEPEPVLDLGWFNEPASRTLLLHTRVFGDYDGPEEVISKNRNYTEINVVDNYGKTAKTTFTIIDQQGQPQANLPVEFKIYNYAEFCTVAKKTTDENGQTWLTAGLGCMMAYAAKDGHFGYQVFKPGTQEHVTITLDHQENSQETFEFDMIPPSPSALTPEVTPEMRAENNRRLALEDSLRNAYIADCKKAQQELIMNTGNKTLCRIYEKTWGNYQTIADFMQYAQSKQQETKAVNLLRNISDKDLRDVRLEVLKDHLDNTPDLSTAPSLDPELYHTFILNPRISNELLTPYRKALSGFFNEHDAAQFQEHPALLVDWVRQNIRIDNERNPQRIPISPLGVLKAQAADSHSRDIFFVAMARCLGIPAQINPVTGKVQCHEKEWMNVEFEAEQPTVAQTGYLDLHYQPIASIPDPKYYTHFSIKRFDGNSFDLLAYDAQDPGIDDGMTLSSFDHPTPLEAGYYILTAGNRLEDGTALTHSEFFTIVPNKTTPVNLVLREPDIQLQTLGHFTPQTPYYDLTSQQKHDLLDEVNNNYYILGFLDTGSEPTTHAMQDIAILQKEFENLQTPMFFIFNTPKEHQKFMLKNFKNLPQQVVFGTDNGKMMEELCDRLNIESRKQPIFIIGKTNGDVLFVKQGYTIGLGEQLLKIASRL